MKPGKWSEEFLRALSFTERLSYASKMASGGAWAKRKASAYAKTYSKCFDDRYAERVTDSLLLLSGVAMKNYKKKPADQAKLERLMLLEEGIDQDNLITRHYDTVTFYVEGLLGDQQRRELKYGVTDSSLYTQNFIKREEERVTLDYFRNKYILPAREQATVMYMQEKGIQDLYSLPPQARQEMQVDIDKRVDQLTPRNIRRYFKYGVKGEMERRGQELADVFVADSRLKFIMDQAYYYSYATGAMVFKQGIRNGEPYLKHVADTRNFNTWGTPALFIDNNTGYRYEYTMHPSDILDTWGELFTREDFKNFSDFLSRGSDSSNKVTARDEQWVVNIPFESLQDLGEINMLSREGQKAYGRMEDRYSGQDYKTMDMVKVIEIVWKSLRKFKQVMRAYPDGTIRFDWHAEDYTFNRLNGDLKMTTHWFNEYWKTVIIGEGDHAVYVDMGPCEVQFRDITNPRRIRGPFTGAFWNDMQGMGQRRAPLDKVKPYVDAINFEFKIIHEREATDVGKVVLMTIAAKPPKWTWGKYIRVIRATKLLPIDTRGAGLTPADVAFFRELDMSNMYELIPRLNLIQMYMNKIAEALAVNEARRGVQAASTSVTNNMMNMDRSMSQTHHLSEWYDAIAESLILNGIYLYRMAAKDGNIFIRRALSDLSIHTIDTQVDDTDDARYFVKVYSDELDLKNVDIGKNIVHPMMQTSGNTPAAARDALRLMTAKSLSQIDDVLDEAEMENEIQQAKMQQVAMMNQQQLHQQQLDLMEMAEELRKNRELLLSADKKEMAALNAMVQANAADINKNNQNDFAETADKDRQLKREELLLKTGLEREKLQILRQKSEKVRAVPTK